MAEIEYYGEKYPVKLCPCCGGEARLGLVRKQTYETGEIITHVYIICNECGMRTRNVTVSPAYSAIGVAVDCWNRRVEKEDNDDE